MTKEIKNKCHEVAFSIGTALCRHAVWHKDLCTWLGLQTDNSGKTISHTVDYNFYEGTAGISFFLSNLYKKTGSNLFGKTALGAIHHAYAFSEKYPGEFPESFYCGKSGIAYTSMLISDIYRKKEYAQNAFKIMENIIPEKISEYDIISGSAGVIPVLIYASIKSGNKIFMKKAVELGDILCDKAIKEISGWSWKPPSDTGPALTGFSHGASGVAYAMLLIYKYSGVEKYLRAADNAFDFEDQFYNQQVKNWPDMREMGLSPTGGKQYAMAWCHGAPGIGFARLTAKKITERNIYNMMIKNACDVTAQFLAQNNNYSLCHGRTGNAELLLHSFSGLNNKYRRAAENVALEGIENIHNRGVHWPCGIYTGQEVPGFMIGLAGIGNFYLRLAHDCSTPSGLILNEVI